MTTSRKLRPLECHSNAVESFHLHVLGVDRLFEPGDAVVFCGHNGEWVQVQVEDRSGKTRWIDISDDQIFVCETVDATRN